MHTNCSNNQLLHHTELLVGYDYVTLIWTLYDYCHGIIIQVLTCSFCVLMKYDAYLFLPFPTLL